MFSIRSTFNRWGFRQKIWWSLSGSYWRRNKSFDLRAFTAFEEQGCHAALASRHRWVPLPVWVTVPAAAMTTRLLPLRSFGWWKWARPASSLPLSFVVIASFMSIVPTYLITKTPINQLLPFIFWLLTSPSLILFTTRWGWWMSMFATFVTAMQVSRLLHIY